MSLNSVQHFLARRESQQIGLPSFCDILFGSRPKGRKVGLYLFGTFNSLRHRILQLTRVSLHPVAFRVRRWGRFGRKPLDPKIHRFFAEKP
jgi:hypothetical protein